MFEGWAAAAAIGGTVVGGAIAAHGATSAAETQANAANNAQQISQQEFNTITQQNQPFLNAGYGALSELNYGLGVGGNPTAPAPGTSGPAGLGYGSLVTPFTAENFKQLSPAYNFQMQQGQQNVLNADTAGKGALSGSAYKDLIDYNQAQANTSFNNAFNQYQTQQGNIYSRLAGVAQIGQASANNTGQQGTALAGQSAQSATNIGTALGAGQVGAANAISGGISSAIPWLVANTGTNPDATSGAFGSNPSGDAAAGDYAAWSDRRLKFDIERIGTLLSGLPFYRFRYTFAPAHVRMGVMADEVTRILPEAVSSLLGYLRVDYARVW